MEQPRITIEDLDPLHGAPIAPATPIQARLHNQILFRAFATTAGCAIGMFFGTSIAGIIRLEGGSASQGYAGALLTTLLGLLAGLLYQADDRGNLDQREQRAIVYTSITAAAILGPVAGMLAKTDGATRTVVRLTYLTIIIGCLLVGLFCAYRNKIPTLSCRPLLNLFHGITENNDGGPDLEIQPLNENRAVV